MKRLIPTLLALVLLIAGFWYVKSQDFFREPATTQLPLFDLLTDQVDTIDLQYEDQAITLTRSEDGAGWTDQELLAYPLDSKKIENWLTGMLAATDDGVVEEAIPGNLADFGLEPPARKLTVTLADGTEQTIQVGNEMPVRGHHYLIKSGESKLYQISNEPLDTLFRDRLYFTDTRVMPYELSGIHSITYTLGEEKWELIRQGDANASYNAPWKLDGHDVGYTDISGILGQTIYMTSEVQPLSVSDMTMDNVHLQIVVEEYVGGELVRHEVVGEVKDEQTALLWEMGKYWGYTVKIDDLEKLYTTGLEAIQTAEAKQAPEKE